MGDKEAKKPIITMFEAVTALNRIKGQEMFPTDGNDVYVLCPECKDRHEGYRQTMNIDYRNNVFRCARCGFHGGVYAFISYYTGWEMKDVKANLQSGKLAGAKILEQGISSESSSEPSVQLAPLTQRNRVYTEMLRILTLSENHKEDLLRRGLTVEDIKRIGFKSVRRFMDPSVLAKKLVGSGFDLRGVPGFGLSGGVWKFSRQPDDGFLIPLRNGKGLILGFQIRFDHGGTSDSIPKYGYLTSKGMENGVKAGGWPAWAGPDVTLDQKPFDVIITEGSLKGYIINARTGHPVISVPGVSALKKAIPALKSMKDFGLRTVYIAYDMDSETNPDVNRQLNKLRQTLAQEKIKYKTLKWDREYKGLDDWIVAHNVTAV